MDVKKNILIQTDNTTPTKNRNNKYFYLICIFLLIVLIPISFYLGLKYDKNNDIQNTLHTGSNSQANNEKVICKEIDQELQVLENEKIYDASKLNTIETGISLNNFNYSKYLNQKNNKIFTQILFFKPVRFEYSHDGQKIKTGHGAKLPLLLTVYTDDSNQVVQIYDMIDLNSILFGGKYSLGYSTATSNLDIVAIDYDFFAFNSYPCMASTTACLQNLVKFRFGEADFSNISIPDEYSPNPNSQYFGSPPETRNRNAGSYLEFISSDNKNLIFKLYSKNESGEFTGTQTVVFDTTKNEWSVAIQESQLPKSDLLDNININNCLFIESSVGEFILRKNIDETVDILFSPIN